MHWQEAIAASPVRVAERRTMRGHEVVIWRRDADGSAYYVFRGEVEIPSPIQVEGFLDWVPVS